MLYQIRDGLLVQVVAEIVPVISKIHDLELDSGPLTANGVGELLQFIDCDWLISAEDYETPRRTTGNQSLSRSGADLLAGSGTEGRAF